MPGHDRLCRLKGASSGRGDKDRLAAIGEPGTIAIQQACQFNVGIGHRDLLAIPGVGALDECLPIIRAAIAYRAYRGLDASSEPLAAFDTCQIEIVIVHHDGMSLAIAFGRGRDTQADTRDGRAQQDQG